MGEDVRAIVEAVQARGNAALAEYTSHGAKTHSGVAFMAASARCEPGWFAPAAVLTETRIATLYGIEPRQAAPFAVGTSAVQTLARTLFAIISSNIFLPSSDSIAVINS